MSDITKQRTSGTICLLGTGLAVFCISKMIPYGLAGDSGKVKLWFVPAILLLAVSIASGVAYYFYGNRTKDKNIERLHTEADILARAGHKPAQPTPAYPEQDRPKESSKQN